MHSISAPAIPCTVVTGAANSEYDCLHFEACYYQGIEYCIEQGLSRFDPGAQGEHKIQRGFQPVTTWSNHWIADPELAAAVADFTRREERHNEQYRQATSQLLPFRMPDADEQIARSQHD